MAASWANICVRVWGNTEDNWTVFDKLNKALKEACDDANILIPFPQHRVHIESDVISK
tara:strand:+ start:7037 stop:7210 length:174 start_codon:yes stop_codon:yes gene_type:complete